MGHAYPANLSKIFIRQLYAKGKISITDVANHCLNQRRSTCRRRNQGEEGLPMIKQALMEIIDFLCQPHELKELKTTPVVETCDLSNKQIEIYNQWCADEIDEWDCGDDGTSGEYGVFDSIKWKFAPGWRKQYPNIPVLDYICS